MLRRTAYLLAAIAVAGNLIGHLAGLALRWRATLSEAWPFAASGLLALLVTCAHLFNRFDTERPDLPGSIHQQLRRPLGLIPPLWAPVILGLLFYVALLGHVAHYPKV